MSSKIQFGKARTAGTAAGTIVSAALRQVAQLHKARLAIEEGASIGEASERIQPFVHFSRKPSVEAALRTWTSARLEHAMAQLAEAALEARRQSALAELIAQRALLALAVNARRSETGMKPPSQTRSGSILLQPPQHVVELIEAAVVDLQHAALAAMIDRDGETERIRHPPLERQRIGVLDRALLDRLARPFRRAPSRAPRPDGH